MIVYRAMHIHAFSHSHVHPGRACGHSHGSRHPAEAKPQIPPVPAQALKLVDLKSSATHRLHCTKSKQHILFRYDITNTQCTQCIGGRYCAQGTHCKHDTHV